MKYPILAVALIALVPSFAFAKSGDGPQGSDASNNGSTVEGAAPNFEGLPDEPSVPYNGPMVVGSPMPQDYTYYPVPQFPDYDYVILNGQRVIVDHKTHTIYRILP